ncbi:MAG: serine hydrolase domain-containing protein [Vicinamibacterales bacterium]
MLTWRGRFASGATCAALAAVLTGLLHAQPPAPKGPPWAAQVDAVFAQWNRPDSPGCALGVFQDGRTAYSRGYGMADLEHDAPITPGSVFYAGSVSKQFTAMAAALAIKQGKLGPDDDVRKYVPELPEYGRPITLRHLLHHTSGLRDVNTLMALAGRRDEDAFDNEAVLRIVSRQKALNFLPGDEYLYSNSGYAMLALAIERATGVPFDEYAEVNIFGPLGMKASHFHTDLTRLVPGRAWAYDKRTDGSFVLNSPQNERAGAGGLFTTVRELGRWDENFYDARVGGPDIIRMLETPGHLNSGNGLTYGWGLMAGSYRGVPIIEHSGSLGGYRAHLIRFRPMHTSVAILCNVSNVTTRTIVRRVADAVLALRFGVPAGPPPPPPPIPVPSGLPYRYEGGELKAFAGEYYSEELESTYRVSVDGTSLRLRRGVQRRAFTLVPHRKDEFDLPGSAIRFRRGPDGAVAGLVVDADRTRGLAFQKR